MRSVPLTGTAGAPAADVLGPGALAGADLSFAPRQADSKNSNRIVVRARITDSIVPEKWSPIWRTDLLLEADLLTWQVEMLESARRKVPRQPTFHCKFTAELRSRRHVTCFDGHRMSDWMRGIVCP
jgi:hypothetical protein